MDIETIPRRERRHFRKYINGEIVYSDVPFGNEEKHNYSSNNIKNKNLTNFDKNTKNLIDQKEEKIQQVLHNISDIVAPDIDSVAEAIYNQVSKDNQFNDFKKEEIEETIKQSKHYRASKKNDENIEIIETENLKSLVEDVLSQLEKEEVVKEDKIKEEVKKEKNNKKEEKEIKKNKENTINKKDNSKNKKENKSEIQDLLDEDSDNLDFNDDENDDELGLKF